MFLLVHLPCSFIWLISSQARSSWARSRTQPRSSFQRRDIKYAVQELAAEHLLVFSNVDTLFP